MITISEKARELIANNNITEVYLELRYSKGPCSDNLCKMIPHVDVSLVKHSSSYLVIYEEQGLRILAVPPVANSIKKHNDEVYIFKPGFAKTLRISGITYSF
jgi:hypothetical protein